LLSLVAKTKSHFQKNHDAAVFDGKED
jgi:hypothetical protein